MPPFSARARTLRSHRRDAVVAAGLAVVGTALAVFAAAGVAVAGVPATVAARTGPGAGADRSAPGGRTYYLDAVRGDDAASGRSPVHPWRSLGRVSATTFQPGDRILLRAGDHWDGQLWPKGSGTAGASILVDRYGGGADPRIDGGATVADTVRLFNQQYWTIRHLEVTNTAPDTGTPGANLGDFRGIHVSGDDGQTLSGFVVDRVHVHDVTGEVDWIGGDPAGNAPGIHFKAGWDGSKKTGGIVFDTTVPDLTAPPANATVLNDITVENSVVADTSFAGVVVKQYTGDGRTADGTAAVATGWGSRASAADPKFTPHTNVVIRDNDIIQAGTAYGCDGIYLTDVRGAVVDHNVVDHAGTSGIETYFSDAVTIENNEVFGTTQKAGGADFNGIDSDKATTGVLVQYNFVHDNGDGILICQFSFGSAVFRYNVIVGNSRYQVYLHSDRAATANIYNNTVYNDRGTYLVYGYGSSLKATYHLTNNLLSTTQAAAALTTSATITYASNLYAGPGLSPPAGDTAAVVGDPLFVAPALSSGPATGPRPLSAFGLRVRSGSPAIDAGTPIADNGGRDFAGTPVSADGPDIGAFEYVHRHCWA